MIRTYVFNCYYYIFVRIESSISIENVFYMMFGIKQVCAINGNDVFSKLCSKVSELMQI